MSKRISPKKQRALERIAKQGGGVNVDYGKLLKKYAPKDKIKSLVSADAQLKKTALGFLDKADFLSKKQIQDTALKTLKSYRQRAKDGTAKKRDLVDDPKQLIQRVQNEAVKQIAETIRLQYEGEFYQWLPSAAAVPEPEHQLLYGKIFPVGEGDSEGNMPGDRDGCKCGMLILVKDQTKLEL